MVCYNRGAILHAKIEIAISWTYFHLNRQNTTFQIFFSCQHWNVCRHFETHEICISFQAVKKSHPNFQPLWFVFRWHDMWPSLTIFQMAIGNFCSAALLLHNFCGSQSIVLSTAATSSFVWWVFFFIAAHILNTYYVYV